MKKNELDMDKQENDSVSHMARVRTTPRTPDGRGSSVSVGHVLGRGWGFPGENATPHDAACGGAKDRLRDLPPEDRGFSAHLPGDLGLQITSPAAWERHGGWGRPGHSEGKDRPQHCGGFERAERPCGATSQTDRPRPTGGPWHGLVLRWPVFKAFGLSLARVRGPDSPGNDARKNHSTIALKKVILR